MTNEVSEPLSIAVSSITGCGSGVFILFLVVAVSIFFNWYLLSSFFGVLKDGITTINDLKGKLDELSNENFDQD